MDEQSPASGTALPDLPQHGDEDGGIDPSHRRSGGAQVEAYYIGSPRPVSDSCDGGAREGAAGAKGPGQVPKLPPRLGGDQPGYRRPPADEVKELSTKDKLRWVQGKLAEGRDASQASRPSAAHSL